MGSEIDKPAKLERLRDEVARLTHALNETQNLLVTERKRFQEELSRSKAELARFASIASHDLKEPLRVVSNYVQLLKMQYGDKLDAKAEQYIDFAVDGVKHMYDLINDVLDFSRIGNEPENLENTDLNEVIRKVLASLAPALKESEAAVISGPLPTLVVDGGQMTQLLQNLVSNAVKYRSPDRKPHVEISAEKKNSDWIFAVKDNGIGIEGKYFEKIFVLFNRLHGKDHYSGTGMGLAICKKIVERHGGRIWVESEPGKGSVFFFVIRSGGS